MRAAKKKQQQQQEDNLICNLFISLRLQFVSPLVILHYVVNSQRITLLAVNQTAMKQFGFFRLIPGEFVFLFVHYTFSFVFFLSYCLSRKHKTLTLNGMPDTPNPHPLFNLDPAFKTALTSRDRT